MPRRLGLHRAFAIALLALAPPATAWDAATHRWIAETAWRQLTPPARKRVGELAAAHPDAEALRARIRPSKRHPAALFAELAVWPDLIRDDPRFHDALPARPSEIEDPVADRARHRDWHYLNRPIGPGHAQARPGDGQLDRALVAASQVLGDTHRSAAARGVALAWFAHLVGDAHQPLHVASWFSATGDSDRGGNRVWVLRPLKAASESVRLHVYWDGAARPLPSTGDDSPRRREADAPPGVWFDESFALARDVAYPAVVNLDAPPVLLDATFVAATHELALARIRTAAARLAARLNALPD